MVWFQVVPIDPNTILQGIAATIGSVSASIALLERSGKSKAELETQDTLVTLKSQLLDLREAVLQLQEENGQLRAKLREQHRGTDKSKNFERRKIGQGWVMVPIGEEEPYFCPTCLDAGRESTLQLHPMRGGGFGSHYCSQCKTSFSLR